METIIQEKTSLLDILKVIFMGMPYRIVYIPSSYTFDDELKKVYRVSSKLLWKNYEGTYVLRLNDYLEYDDAKVVQPTKKIILSTNKESNEDKKLWQDVEED